MATSVPQNATGNPYVDALLIGTKWNGAISFSFPQNTAHYPVGYAAGELGTFAAVSLQQREAVRAILTGDTFNNLHNVIIATSLASFIVPVVAEAGGLGNGLDGSGDLRIGQSATANPTAY